MRGYVGVPVSGRRTGSECRPETEPLLWDSQAHLWLRTPPPPPAHRLDRPPPPLNVLTQSHMYEYKNHVTDSTNQFFYNCSSSDANKSININTKVGIRYVNFNHITCLGRVE